MIYRFFEGTGRPAAGPVVWATLLMALLGFFLDPAHGSMLEVKKENIEVKEGEVPAVASNADEEDFDIPELCMADLDGWQGVKMGELPNSLNEPERDDDSKSENRARVAKLVINTDCQWPNRSILRVRFI